MIRKLPAYHQARLNTRQERDRRLSDPVPLPRHRSTIQIVHSHLIIPSYETTVQLALHRLWLFMRQWLHQVPSFQAYIMSRLMMAQWCIYLAFHSVNVAHTRTDLFICCKRFPVSNTNIADELRTRRVLPHLQDWRCVHQDGTGHSVETVATAQQHPSAIFFVVRRVTFKHGY
jgi:hypothetical protein